MIVLSLLGLGREIHVVNIGSGFRKQEANVNRIRREIFSLGQLGNSAFAFAAALVVTSASQGVIAAPKAKGAAAGVASIARTVYDTASPSVVVVHSQDGGGSGTVQGSGVAFQNGCAEPPPSPVGQQGATVCIPDSTWIVTNAHVVRDSNRVTVFANGMESTAEVKFRDRDADIALIWADGFAVPKTVISPDINTLRPGDDVFAIGAPKGLDKSISQGIVSAVRPTSSRTLIQTSAAISPGSSGGGLFDAQGRLVGITTLKISGGEGLNFAVSASDLWGWFQANSGASAIAVTALPGSIDRSHDAFARWLFQKRPGAEIRRYEEHAANVSAFLKNPDPQKGFNELRAYQKALREEFTRDLANLQMPSSSKAPQSSSAVIHLSCAVSGMRGDAAGTYPFTVNLAAKTVNNHPARITDDLIEWSPGNLTFRIDRATGLLTQVGDRGSASGSCRKVEGRVF